MPRQSKPKTVVSQTTPVVNNLVENISEHVENVSSNQVKETKRKSAKAVPNSVVVPVPVPVPVLVPVVSDTPAHVDVVEVDTADLAAQSTEFLGKLNQLGSLFASLKSDFRSLEKKWSREIKIAQKSQAKRKRKSGNRQPSGFVKPTKISDELAKFLDKPIGSEMARTDVTREINKYIRSHNLQDKENGRKINPDAKLQTLLKLNNTDELTYFNLQRYMSPHFAKSEKAIALANALLANALLANAV
jgi:chromatin remodeling complex protein RSC6